MQTFTVGAFNAHWGVGRLGAERGARFDVPAVIRRLDADVIVVPESFRFADGRSILDPLVDDGYEIRSVRFSTVETTTSRYGDVRPSGDWELAVCTRLVAQDWKEIPLNPVFRDHAETRHAIACTVDVGGIDVSVVGVHTSSKLWYGGPVVHLRGLVPFLPPAHAPAVFAGDFNLWGPPVGWMTRGWRRAVSGRTYPAHRPHSQIDHILVNDRVQVVRGDVFGNVGSDHRPVRAELRVLA